MTTFQNPIRQWCVEFCRPSSIFCSRLGFEIAQNRKWPIIIFVIRWTIDLIHFTESTQQIDSLLFAGWIRYWNGRERKRRAHTYFSRFYGTEGCQESSSCLLRINGNESWPLPYQISISCALVCVQLRRHISHSLPCWVNTNKSTRIAGQWTIINVCHIRLRSILFVCFDLPIFAYSDSKIR